MNTKEFKAELSSDRYHTVVLVQRCESTVREPRKIATLRVRNVSDLRSDEGHDAHIEVSITALYPTRTVQTSASVVLDKDAAIALANELLKGVA